MSSARVVGIVAGSDFDGGFAQAPAPAEERDELLVALSNLLMEHLPEDSGAALKAEKLIARRAALNAECAAFIVEQVAPIRQKLLDPHEAQKAKCRAQEKKVAAKRAEISEWGRELNERKDAQARVLNSLHNAQGRRKELSRFASRAEILAADGAIGQAEARVDKANESAAEAQQQINHLKLVEMKPLVEELDKLAAEEMRLRALISGESYTNDLGLVVPGRAPL